MSVNAYRVNYHYEKGGVIFGTAQQSKVSASTIAGSAGDGLERPDPASLATAIASIQPTPPGALLVIENVAWWGPASVLT